MATAAASAAPSRREVFSLLRALLRASRSFPDYNVREYARRRTLDGFRRNSAVSDEISLSTAFSDGVAQLEVVRRQSSVYSLFQSPLKSILDNKSSSRIR